LILHLSAQNCFISSTDTKKFIQFENRAIVRETIMEGLSFEAFSHLSISQQWSH